MFIDAFAPTQCRYYFPHDLIAVIVPCLCFISSLISGSTLKKRFSKCQPIFDARTCALRGYY